MRKVALVLTIIFSGLTIVGSIYVLSSGGMENAGYAVIPMILALACLGFCRQDNKSETEEKK